MQHKLLNHSLIFFIGILIFILPIPHTVSIRYITFSIVVLLTFYSIFKYKLYQNNLLLSNPIKYSFYLLLVFTLWLFFVSFFISHEPIWSLTEVVHEWMIPLLYFITFVFLGIFSITEETSLEKNIYYTILIIFFIHILYVDLYALKYYVDHQILISPFTGLTEGAAKANYLTNILLAYLIAEIIYRIKTSKKFLNINHATLGLLLILTLLSSIIEGKRNGVVAILFLGLSAIFFSLKGNQSFSKKLKVLITITLLMSFSIPTFYSIVHDKRWSTFIETIPIALNTQTNRAWLDRNKYPYPMLADGETVSPSNYERVAWAYEGLKLIYENPLGIGYGRNAFRHGIEAKYHLQNIPIGHSHSGIIDLGIGVGIPGVIIWLAFGLFLIYLSYTYFIKYTNFYALILFFNTTGFYGRFLVDGTMRDHMFQTFMMIIGITLVLMLHEHHVYKSTK